ncbi:MAG: anaerobic ribonucleoside-triphosphate reductase activating protein [Clostridiales bacterium]|nr:anaerobic ribonucleoside-triphosphate reductase activating protein [Clostridiales bacterium]
MRICGLIKLSLLDYPEKLAATVFTGGCNLRCPFCHNGSLVLHPENVEGISENELMDFLSSRIGKLEGVCITGGEPLLEPELESFIKKIRSLGFLIKLDTNGSFPDRLKNLMEKGLLDYVAMDIKNSPEKYAETVGIEGFDPAPIFKSAELLMGGNVPFEFRTTMVREMHKAEDIEKIGIALKGAPRFFIQNFEDSGDLIGFEGRSLELHGFSDSELEVFRGILAQYIDKVEIRN